MAARALAKMVHISWTRARAVSKSGTKDAPSKVIGLIHYHTRNQIQVEDYTRECVPPVTNIVRKRSVSSQKNPLIFKLDVIEQMSRFSQKILQFSMESFLTFAISDGDIYHLAYEIKTSNQKRNKVTLGISDIWWIRSKLLLLGIWIQDI